MKGYPAGVTRKGLELMDQIDRERAIVRPWSPEAITLSLLCRHATTYQANQEADCNGPAILDYLYRIKADNATISKAIDDHQNAVEKRRERLDKRIAELAAELGEGWKVETQGDPRGACVSVTAPNGRTGYC